MTKFRYRRVPLGIPLVGLAVAVVLITAAHRLFQDPEPEKKIHGASPSISIRPHNPPRPHFEPSAVQEPVRNNLTRPFRLRVEGTQRALREIAESPQQRMSKEREQAHVDVLVMLGPPAIPPIQEAVERESNPRVRSALWRALSRLTSDNGSPRTLKE